MPAANKIILVVIALVVAGAGGAYYLHWKSVRAEQEVQAKAQANEAMSDINKSQSTLVDQLPKLIGQVAMSGAMSIQKAGVAVKEELLPVVDKFLAQLDNALALSNTYLGFNPKIDPLELEALTNLQTRSREFHAMRDKIAAIADKAAKGDMPIEDLANELTNLGRTLVDNNLNH